MLVFDYQIVVTFSLYIAIVMLIGLIASRRVSNVSDYILGGRNLSGPLAALGAGASDMSGWLLMALPGAAFIHGINQIWLPIGLTLGAYCNWQFVAKRLRVYTEVANDSLTMPAYFDYRFNDHKRILRLVTAVVILIFFTFYVASGFVAGAFLTESVLGLASYHQALLIGGSIVIAYVVLGGFIAVAWIDFFKER